MWGKRIYAPFMDAGRNVTPCYWEVIGRSRALNQRAAINDRIHVSPVHNSVMSWAMQRPPALREASFASVDTLGHSRPMRVQTWVWLIGLTDTADSRLLQWAQSFGSPPSLERLTGVRLSSESFAPEREAIHLIAEAQSITVRLRPLGVCVNPVFEIRNAPSQLLRVTLDESPLPRESYASDGKTLTNPARRYSILLRNLACRTTKRQILGDLLHSLS
jgi:hypothetical protein